MGSAPQYGFAVFSVCLGDVWVFLVGLDVSVGFGVVSSDSYGVVDLFGSEVGFCFWFVSLV